MSFQILVIVGENGYPLSGSDQMALNITRQLAAQPDFQITLGHTNQQRRLSDSKTSAIERVETDCWNTELKLSQLHRSFDLVHLIDISDPRHVRLAMNLSRLQNIPLIVTPATDYSLWREKDQAIAASKQASHIFALTQTESTLFQSWGVHPHKITVIPPAITIGECKQASFRKDREIQEHVPIVLFLGRKLQTKGYELILDSARFVWQSVPDTHFIFIGPDSTYSIEIFRKFQHDKRIINLGMVDESTKNAALHACDVLCMPSVADVFPLVFLEAWSFGKPVIASEMTSIRDIVQDEKDGIIVKHSSIAVAEGVSRLLTNSTLRKKMGAGGLRRVKQMHSSEEIGKQISEIHRRVLLGNQSGEGG